jgi:hypothetical protein
MKRIITCLLYLMAMFTGMAFATTPVALEEAKSLSASSGKPLLLKFYRED